MATLGLLEALNMQGVRTPADVAAMLAIGEGDAIRQLRQAEHEGLVAQEQDESLNVRATSALARHLTQAGLGKMHELQDEQTGR